jgi:hypothetical protein
MKKLIILFILLSSKICISQTYFNKIYRFDSLKNLALQFHSMRIINDSIYLAGISNIKFTDSTYITIGSFTSIKQSGDIVKNTDIGNEINNSTFWDDVILEEPNELFSLIGYNYKGSINRVTIDKKGVIKEEKIYAPFDSTFLYAYPSSYIKTKKNYIIAATGKQNSVTTGMVYITDLDKNYKSKFEFFEDSRSNAATMIFETPKNNLVVSIKKIKGGAFTDTSYHNTSQLREIDTLGKTNWVYNTPANRYIEIKKFIPLANGNYLMWGDEEFANISKNGPKWVRTVYDVKPIFMEVNPIKGIVSEKSLNISGTARIFCLKLQADSSYLATVANNLKSCLIKFDKNLNILFLKYFTPSGIQSNPIALFERLNQIEKLKNGDIVLGGYVTDLDTQAPTYGDWGWLVRTDSMGCSLDTSCSPKALFSWSKTNKLQINFSDKSNFIPQKWKWDFGDGTTSVDTSPIHTYARSGTYRVCLTVMNANGMDTYCTDVSIINTATETPSYSDHHIVKVYPNPASDFVLIEHEQVHGLCKLKLYDALGQEVHSQYLNIMDTNTIVALDKLASGMYYYTLTLDVEVQVLDGGKIILVDN